MKASIRRHGIVIRQLEITGTIARIGSGEDCQIRIDDPYLSAHVADVVRRENEWRIVDAGTSLEGVTRDGSRIDDEPIVGGATYGVGGFELLFGGISAAAAPPQGGRGPGIIPETIADQARPDREVPRTIMDAPRPDREIPRTVMDQPRPKTEPGFRPLATVHDTPVPPRAAAPAAAAAGSAPTKSRKRLLLVAAVGAMIVLLLVVLLATSGGGKAKSEQAKPVATPTPAPTPPPPPPADPVEAGNRFARDLQLDKALQSWEAALDKQPTPELRSRYVQTAYELALVRTAASDTAGARAYFEKVVKYGDANSTEVQAAKARLAR